tara:strand:- start:202 stop:429 length:228 start_codon:yes stop_codon:yes gene_type:complete
MKNFLFLIKFSSPFILILVDRKNFKQKIHQYPISLPPEIAILLLRNNEGRYIIEIIIIPKKKKNLNKKLLIINIM